MKPYDDFLIEMQSTISHDIPQTNSLFSTLRIELDQTCDILESIKPLDRQKRSFNAIGTAWKYLAGSPDHDDLEIITKALDDLTENNNKQFTINRDFNERINKIISTTNQIVNSIKENNFLIDEIILLYQNKLRLIKEELINVKYAILWAKSNVVNSILLNKSETKTIFEELNKENIPFKNIDEALEYATIDVLINKTNLLYIVKVPLTTIENYTNMFIKAVKKENIVINLKYKEYLKYDNKLYGIQNKCKEYNKLKICKRENLVDIADEHCINNLLQGKNATCELSNSHHIPDIEELKPGLIFLNGFSGNLDAEPSYNLNGTFLVQFSNCTIKINGNQYKNLEKYGSKLDPQIIQMKPKEKNRVSLLSLEQLKDLHTQTTKWLQNLQSDANKALAISSVTISIIVIGLIIIMKLGIQAIRTNKDKTEKFITIRHEPQQNLHSTSLHNLPYY